MIPDCGSYSAGNSHSEESTMTKNNVTRKPYTRKCALCGAEFPIQFPSISKKYCSQKCSRSPFRKGKRWTCERCGKAFTPSGYSKAQRFCSRSCWFEWHSGENHQQYDSIELTCGWCGSNFKRNKYEISKSKNHYCCHDCSSKAHSLKMRGMKRGIPQQAGYYTIAEWRNLRQMALERDGFKCVRCGMTESQHKLKYKQSLHVDHIIRRRDGGDDLVDNLQCLCCVCHVKKTMRGE